MTHPMLVLLLGLFCSAMLLQDEGASASVKKNDAGRIHDRRDNYPRVEGAEIRFNERFTLNFQRTLRIPDDGRQYPLPPGLGSFPLYSVAEYDDRVPPQWQRKNAWFIPMYQREALWINFSAAWWKPNAVKVGLGKVNALSGGEWNLSLGDTPQNYLVAPEQPWLDGIKAGEGFIRQFVAVPHGSGYSVEGQLRGKESDEALRIAVYEAKPGRFPDAPPYDDREVAYEDAPAMAQSARKSSMGLGAGGKMRQKVYPDSYGLETWKQESAMEIVVYIINSEDFLAIVGERPPESPVDAETYTAYGYPWFDLYDEHKGDIPVDDALKGVKSTGTLDKDKGMKTDVSVDVPDSLVIKLPQGMDSAPIQPLPGKGKKLQDSDK